MGAALASTVTPDKGQQLLGGYLFVLSPVLVARIGHDTLCAHWLLLGAAVPRPSRVPGRGGARRGAGSATGAVDAGRRRFIPTSRRCAWVLAQAIYVRLWRSRLITAGRCALPHRTRPRARSPCLGALGYFGGGRGSAPAGFGAFSADLLTLVNPDEFSRVLPPLPGRAGRSGKASVSWGSAESGRGCGSPQSRSARPPLRGGRHWPRHRRVRADGRSTRCPSTITFAGRTVLRSRTWFYAPVSRSPRRSARQAGSSGRCTTSCCSSGSGARRAFCRRHPACRPAACSLARLSLQATDLRMDSSLAARTGRSRQAPFSDFTAAGTLPAPGARAHAGARRLPDPTRRTTSTATCCTRTG